MSTFAGRMYRQLIEGSPVEGRVPTRQVSYKPLEDEPLLSTVYDVEICATGIEYPLASGPATFTTEDLLQAVASQDDPAIQAPRVWLGHPDDQRFHAGRTTPVGSAEPALGKVVSMRVEDEGQTLVGDIVGCPTWLAKILASAYPNRSIEGFKDAETTTGRKWNMVVTDLALLGVVWPGVSTLQDLEALYSEDGPDGVEVKEGDTAMTARAGRIEAQGDLEKIRRAFVAQVGDLGIPGWPWIRAVLQDPNELIVDDDEGGLYRVSYDASGDDVVFGSADQVKIQYVNASQKKDPTARGLLVNMLSAGRTVAASWDQRADSRPDTNPGGKSMHIDVIRSIRAKTGLTEAQLPDTATDEQVIAAMADNDSGTGGGHENPNGNPSAPGSPAPITHDPPSTGTTIDPHGTPSPDQVPPGVTASALPPGMIAVPAEQWAATQAGLQTLTAAHQTTQAESDTQSLTAAIQKGKVAPAQREYYEAKLKDPNTREAFRHLLTAPVEKGGLMEGIIPVEARGQDPSVLEATTGPAYDPAWLPEVQQPTAPSKITVEA